MRKSVELQPYSRIFLMSLAHLMESVMRSQECLLLAEVITLFAENGVHTPEKIEKFILSRTDYNENEQLSILAYFEHVESSPAEKICIAILLHGLLFPSNESAHYAPSKETIVGIFDEPVDIEARLFWHWCLSVNIELYRNIEQNVSGFCVSDDRVIDELVACSKEALPQELENVLETQKIVGTKEKENAIGMAQLKAKAKARERSKAIEKRRKKRVRRKNREKKNGGGFLSDKLEKIEEKMFLRLEELIFNDISSEADDIDLSNYGCVMKNGQNRNDVLIYLKVFDEYGQLDDHYAPDLALIKGIFRSRDARPKFFWLWVLSEEAKQYNKMCKRSVGLERSVDEMFEHFALKSSSGPYCLKMLYLALSDDEVWSRVIEVWGGFQPFFDILNSRAVIKIVTVFNTRAMTDDGLRRIPPILKLQWRKFNAAFDELLEKHGTHQQRTSEVEPVVPDVTQGDPGSASRGKKKQENKRKNREARGVLDVVPKPEQRPVVPNQVAREDQSAIVQYESLRHAIGNNLTVILEKDAERRHHLDHVIEKFSSLSSVILEQELNYRKEGVPATETALRERHVLADEILEAMNSVYLLTQTIADILLATLGLIDALPQSLVNLKESVSFLHTEHVEVLLVTLDNLQYSVQFIQGLSRRMLEKIKTSQHTIISPDVALMGVRPSEFFRDPTVSPCASSMQEPSQSFEYLNYINLFLQDQSVVLDRLERSDDMLSQAFQFFWQIPHCINEVGEGLRRSSKRQKVSATQYLSSNEGAGQQTEDDLRRKKGNHFGNNARDDQPTSDLDRMLAIPALAGQHSFFAYDAAADNTPANMEAIDFSPDF